VNPTASPEETPGRFPRWALVTALLLTAMGMGLRLHGLGSQSLWVDEIYSHRISTLPLGEILAARPGDKPPLDYALQHLSLQALGDTETALRLPAAVAGSLTPLALFALVCALFGTSAGLAAMTALVFSPLHMRYSQEARPYAPMFLLITVATWSLVEVQRRESERRRLWALHTLAVIAATWTHYLSLLWMLLLQVWCWAMWLRRRRTPEARRAFAAARGAGLVMLVAVLSVAPLWLWLPHGESHGADDPFTFNLSLLGRTLLLFAFGATHEQAPPVAGAVGLALALLGFLWGWRRSPEGTSLLLLLFGGMWGVCLVFYAAIDHWLATRYFTPGMLPLAALEGLGVVALAHMLAGGLPRHWASRAQRSAVALGLLLAALGLSAGIWMIRNPYHKEDWRGLVTWLGENRPPGHTVLLADPLHRDPIEHHAQRAGIPLQVVVPSDASDLQGRASEQGDCTVLLPRGLTSGPVCDWLNARAPMESPIADFQIWRLIEGGTAEVGSGSVNSQTIDHTESDSLNISPNRGEVSGEESDTAP
jgi:dolichyl-phosphate-mannose-protein mannosyltransferase